MAYVTIPKDLSKVQSKVLFGLTKRQVICFGAAAIIGVPLFLFDQRGAGHHHGGALHDFGHAALLPVRHVREERAALEVFLGHLIENKFIRPKTRIYQTNNLYSALVRQYELEQEVRAIAGKTARPANRQGQGAS